MPDDRKNAVNDNAVIALNLSKFQRAEVDLQEAKNAYQSVTKHVEGKGINLKAAKRALKIKKAGKTDDAIAELKALFTYLRIFNVPVTKDQIEMFDHEPKRQPAVEKGYELGLYAGRMGDGEGENPYDPTSPQGQAFLKGLAEGAEERRLVLQMEADEEHERFTDDDDSFPGENDDAGDDEDGATPPEPPTEGGEEAPSVH